MYPDNRETITTSVREDLPDMKIVTGIEYDPYDTESLVPSTVARLYHGARTPLNTLRKTKLDFDC